MISERAGASLRLALHKAGRLRLLQRPDQDQLDIIELAAGELLKTPADLVLITISSLDFRLLVLLGVHDSPDARSYYRVETFGEIANLFCGVISQEMQQAFPDLGMSTPCSVRRASLPHLLALQPQWLDGCRLRINHSVEVSALLCLFAAGELDFQLNVDAKDAGGGGELELF